MSDYLDRLESELVRAGFRERRRHVPVAPILAACAAILVALGLIYAPSGDERAAEPAGTVDAQVKTSFLDDRPPLLRVGVVADEPVAVEVVIDGKTAATTEAAPGAGAHFDVEAAAGAQRAVVTVTDDDGNERRFATALAAVPAPPPLEEDFAVISEANVGPLPWQVRDGLIDVGPNPVTYEAYSGPYRGDADVIVSDTKVCVLYYGPTDATAFGCYDDRETLRDGRAGPAVSGRDLIALVPDGVTDVRVTSNNGTEQAVEVVGNVAVAFGVEPDSMTWVTPDGQMVGFGGERWDGPVSVLSDATVVPVPPVVRRAVDSRGVADYVVHEAFIDRTGDGWVIDTGERLCLMFVAPSGAEVFGCLPFGHTTGFVQAGNDVLGLVPDGAAPGGATLAQYGNFVVARDAEVGELRF